MARATKNWKAIADHHVYRLTKRQERAHRFWPPAPPARMPPLHGPLDPSDAGPEDAA